MSDERPNVTVVYQTVPAKGPGLVSIVVELVAFLAMLGLAGLLAGLLGNW